MTPWIPLTETFVERLLDAAQREALSARPNQGQDNDPLTLAIGEATRRLRLAILENNRNQLSDDANALPPELISTAAALSLGALDGLLPGLTLSDNQLDWLDDALSRLSDIARGELPVSLPADAAPASLVRRTPGVCVVRRRQNRLTGQRLAWL